MCFFFKHESPVQVEQRKASKLSTQETNIFTLNIGINTCHSIDPTRTPIKRKVLKNTVLHFRQKLFLAYQRNKKLL